MTSFTKLFFSLALLGIVFATSPANALAQSEAKSTSFKVTAPEADEADLSLTGPCDISLSGSICVDNQTGKTIIVALCVDGGLIRLGPIGANDSDCFPVPGGIQPGTSGSLKVWSRCGSAEKRVTFTN